MSRYSGGQDNQFWLMAWDGRADVVERMGRPPINLPYLLVGVVGGLQPDKLAEVFKGAADGLYARFLYAWPSAAPYRPLSDDMEGIDDGLVTVLDRLASLPPRTPARLRLTDQARATFEQLRKQVHSDAKLLDGREREWWAKVPTQVLRLAGTLAYLQWAVDGTPSRM